MKRKTALWATCLTIVATIVAFAVVSVAMPASARTGNDSKTDSLIQALHLPPTTQMAAESDNLVVFTNVDSTYEDEMDMVSLWIYRPKTHKLVKLLTTHPRGNYQCIGSGSKAEEVDLASIPTISSVKINCEENKIMVQGWDERNCYSYVISLTKGFPTIQLPCCLGVDDADLEEDLLLTKSYNYYNNQRGGRYSVITVLDWEGNCLKKMSLKAYAQEENALVKLYKDQLEKCYRKAAAEPGPADCQYFLNDLDNDGMPELFVKYGQCEANYKLDIYKIKGHQMKKIHETYAGHRDFTLKDGGLNICEAGGGLLMAYRLTMKNGKVSEKLISKLNLFEQPYGEEDEEEETIERDPFESKSENVEWYDYKNTFPLKDALLD